MSTQMVALLLVYEHLADHIDSLSPTIYEVIMFFYKKYIIDHFFSFSNVHPYFIKGDFLITQTCCILVCLSPANLVCLSLVIQAYATDIRLYTTLYNADAMYILTYTLLDVITENI